ncbi:phosphoenolpyruvate-protein phosphotransferase [Pseudomonas sp. NFACC23-1]|uniref:phosphoenolpyruvate--protein phosphotransferase n=1 Tax=unclassified Pseudomonas TaxID=196821 RepID=UPI00088967B5|nr:MULTISPECIES: phosphoenolpyruvate--protein phosphotransferase [unclassified Pseudomonas]SDB48566.1 phosphoenolpyruvate-protein phosphotransferase [Pseudomonas sp. NFACC17-2]SEJ66990.1 phosphoenolpyruvate-protein phosphotransferase [Pseudomonas sp. NFACC23-1]SFW83461.1 phosphoenolpyruvate-protein phosphotransferase [Pseudomonas sp. NFACC16-2]
MNTTQPLQLLAPLSGVLMPLDKVPDPVFSNRVVGDGICIDPTSQTLCAPLSGVVGTLQDSAHAVSVTSDNGVQVLMHIGLDTVNLAGKGFTSRVEIGQRVEAGQPLIDFDADYIALHARSLLTLMLVVTGEDFSLIPAQSSWVESGQPLLQVSQGTPGQDAQTQQGSVLFSKPLILPNDSGLHARPAAVFAQAAKGFEANICLHKQQASANAKSLVAIMALQTVKGDSLQLSAAGPQAEQALEALTQLLLAGCGESVQAQPTPEVPMCVESPTPERWQGVCASPGSVSGVVVQIATQALEVQEPGAGIETEQALLDQALNQANQALKALQNEGAGSVQAQIFGAHQELLEDPTLLEQARDLIVEGKSAAFAWKTATEATATQFQQSGSALLAERATDLSDVGHRVLKLILGVRDHAWDLPEQSILVTAQLTPSQTANLDTSRIAGFVTVGGGATSHVAILARALGLPSLCGVPEQVLTLANGTPVLLDADSGELHLNPDAARIEQLQASRDRQLRRQRRDLEQSAQAARTLDGHRVEITANVGSLRDVEQAMTLGGEGVGLLRSELLYLDRAHPPGHDEQALLYSAVARALGAERNLVVRTLDVGGDKPLAYVPMAREANPFLGMRGIRLCLERPQLLREQFRAILACSGLARLHIMLPMVTQLSELRQARQILNEEVRNLGLSQAPKLGIMIEVPAAALMADLFAPEVDFFSIGTNDLTQYTLAMDRDHPRLASQADGLHPSVLRLIARTVEAAHAHGKWVGVCGALASETLAVPVLLGLGVDELSVSVPLIPAIKACVREWDLSECRTLAQQALAQESAEQVRDLLRRHLSTASSATLVMEH